MRKYLKATLFGGYCCVLAAAGRVGADPLPNIGVNGADGQLTLSTTDAFSVTVGLDPGDPATTQGDWWLVAHMPWGHWAYFVYPDGWRDAGTSLDGIEPSYQGPLIGVSGLTLLSGSGLLEGTYRLYFGVDRTRNGQLDTPNYYDGIALTVQGGAVTTNVAGDWVGAWSSGWAFSGTFAVSVVQWGSQLGGSISVPEIGMSDAQLKGSVQGSDFVFGDIDDTITFSGTLGGSTSASGTYTYSRYGDSGNWRGLKGSGGPGSSGCADASGSWGMVETVQSSDCGDVGEVDFVSYSIVQSGCRIALVDDYSGLFEGNGSGNVFSLNGSRPDGGGVTRIESASLTISADGNLSGSSSWTWSDGSSTCSGQSTFTGEQF